MGKVMVVVVLLGYQLNTCLMCRAEQCVVQVLISELAVEALNEAALHGLAG